MSYTYPNTNDYAYFWVIEGMTQYVLSEIPLDLPYGTNIIAPVIDATTSTDTVNFWIDTTTKELADQIKAYITEAKIRADESLYIFNTSFTLDLNNKFKAIYDIINFNATETANTFAKIRKQLLDAGITDQRITATLDSVADLDNANLIPDSFSIAVHSLQNDAGGNYIFVAYPIVTDKLASITDINVVDLNSLIFDTSFHLAIVKDIEKISTGIKIYFETQGYHFQNQDYVIGGDLKPFDLTVRFERKKLSSEMFSSNISLLAQDLINFENATVGA